jgi:hypothetical protein
MSDINDLAYLFLLIPGSRFAKDLQAIEDETQTHRIIPERLMHLRCSGDELAL